MSYVDVPSSYSGCVAGTNNITSDALRQQIETGGPVGKMKDARILTAF